MKPGEQSLSRQQIEDLVRMLELTKETEFTCGECLQNAGEFAEAQLEGRPLGETLARVEQHLALCPECREEYTALLKLLKGGK